MAEMGILMSSFPWSHFSEVKAFLQFEKVDVLNFCSSSSEGVAHTQMAKWKLGQAFYCYFRLGWCWGWVEKESKLKVVNWQLIRPITELQGVLKKVSVSSGTNGHLFVRPVV